jgi:hypothetical protein
MVGQKIHSGRHALNQPRGRWGGDVGNGAPGNPTVQQRLRRSQMTTQSKTAQQVYHLREALKGGGTTHCGKCYPPIQGGHFNFSIIYNGWPLSY